MHWQASRATQLAKAWVFAPSHPQRMQIDSSLICLQTARNKDRYNEANLRKRIHSQANNVLPAVCSARPSDYNNSPRVYSGDGAVWSIYMQPARLGINHLRFRFSSWVDRKKFKLRCEQLSVRLLHYLSSPSSIIFLYPYLSGEILPGKFFSCISVQVTAQHFEKILINFLSSSRAKLALI